MAKTDPVTYEDLGPHCEKHQEDCHKLLAAQMTIAVNGALDDKLSKKGVVFMTWQHFVVTIFLAIGTGFGGLEVFKLLLKAYAPGAAP